jgi:hypothetical protein
MAFFFFFFFIYFFLPSLPSPSLLFPSRPRHDDIQRDQRHFRALPDRRGGDHAARK